MGYRTINLERKPSRISDTIGVTARGVTFNRLVRKRMGITTDSRVAFLVNDDGFLTVNVLGGDSPTGKKPTSLGTTLIIISAELARHTTPGRYHITGRDGAFWITDIKWED